MVFGYRLHNLIVFVFLALAVLPQASFAGALDTDGDGVPDPADNCVLDANADQRDTNADGFGNVCDPDLNNDGMINFLDLTIMADVFFSADPDADLDGSGLVNFVDLTIMADKFFGQPGPSGAIVWVSTTDGDWETPENWSPLGPPQPQSRVIINVAGDDPTITIASLDAEVFVIESQERLVISDGLSLTVTDSGTLAGETMLGADATLAVRDGATLTVDGIAELGDGNLQASEGATMSLPALASFVALADQRDWTASGTGSTLSFPNLGSIEVGMTTAAALQVRFDIRAVAGGVVDLPVLGTVTVNSSDSFEVRDIDFEADGGGSRVQMPQLTQFSDLDTSANPDSLLLVSDGGAIEIPGLTQIDSVALDLEGAGGIGLNQITSWTNGNLIFRGSTLAFPNLVDLDGTALEARDGASLEFTSVTTHTVDRDVRLRATGAGSVMSFPTLLNLTAGVPGTGTTARLDIEALAGGLIDMPAVSALLIEDSGSTHVRDITITANNVNSAVLFPQLTSFVDNDSGSASELNVSSGGVIDIPQITSLVAVDLDYDGAASSVDIAQITSWTDSRLTFTGTVFELSGLADIQSSSLRVFGGAELRLPNIASYQTNIDQTEWVASGVGSLLQLANLSSATAGIGSGTTVRWDIEAIDGGVIDLSALSSMQVVDSSGVRSRNIDVIANGVGAEVRLPMLSSFSDLDFSASLASSLSALGGGDIDTPLLTTLDNVDLDVDSSSGYDIAQITAWTNAVLEFSGVGENLTNLVDINDTGIRVNGGGAVILSGITSFENDLDGLLWRAQGAGSVIELPNLTSMSIGGTVVSTTVRMDVATLGGGVIEMPQLDALIVNDSGGVNIRNIEISADGAGSAVLMPLLSVLDDLDLSASLGSEVAASNGGVVQMPLVTNPTAIDLMIDGTSTVDYAQFISCVDCVFVLFDTTFSFPSLSDFTNSELEARDGAVINMPSVASYTIDLDRGQWLVDGAGSQINFANLVSIMIGSVAGGTTSRVDFTADNGGQINLTQLTNLLVNDSGGFNPRNLEVLADGAGSLVSLPVLASFIDDDNVPVLPSELTAINSGIIDYPPGATLINVNVTP